MPSVSASPSASVAPSASPTPAAGTVTGTLVYAEPATLSADARAVVLLVAGSTTPTTETIVGTQIIAPTGQQPIAFSVGYQTADIDPNLTYTIQAEILDGDHAWATTSGVKVLTKGNPSSAVTVKLTLRSDLLKGEVTGQITGVGIQLGAGAYSAAVLVRADTGETLGVDVNPAPTTVPIPFSIAFDPATIDPDVDYVVRAEIVSGSRRWEDTTGVPVITKGNQLTGVSVPVTEVAASVTEPLGQPGTHPGREWQRDLDLARPAGDHPRHRPRRGALPLVPGAVHHRRPTGRWGRRRRRGCRRRRGGHRRGHGCRRRSG